MAVNERWWRRRSERTRFYERVITTGLSTCARPFSCAPIDGCKPSVSASAHCSPRGRHQNRRGKPGPTLWQLRPSAHRRSHHPVHAGGERPAGHHPRCPVEVANALARPDWSDGADATSACARGDNGWTALHCVAPRLHRRNGTAARDDRRRWRLVSAVDRVHAPRAGASRALDPRSIGRGRRNWIDWRFDLNAGLGRRRNAGRATRFSRERRDFDHRAILEGRQILRRRVRWSNVAIRPIFGTVVPAQSHFEWLSRRLLPTYNSARLLP